MGYQLSRSRWFAAFILVWVGACTETETETETETATSTGTDTLSCVDSTGEAVVMGCEGVAVPEPARNDAVVATASESGDTVALDLAWYSESACCFTDIKVAGSLPIASLVPGVHMIDATAVDWGGCNPSGTAPMQEMPLLAIEIVEVTDGCVSGRFFEEADGSSEPGYGFVASRS